jgi:hypothetical protein
MKIVRHSNHFCRMSDRCVSSSDDAESHVISTYSELKVKIYLFPQKKNVFSSVGLHIDALLPDTLPLLIIAVRPSQIPEMRPFMASHECAVHGRHHLTMDDLVSPRSNSRGIIIRADIYSSLRAS